MMGELEFVLRMELEALVAECSFSGVVTVSTHGQRIAEVVSGLADRAHRRPNTIDTQFATASATKGITALAVASVIESGLFTLDTTIRSLIPDALDLVDEHVTIEHLLGHTSGVGDYLDESAISDIDDYLFDVSPHVLASPAEYLRIVDGCPQVTAPGERFAYNNGGYVMLSIAIERATGETFYDLVADRVLSPAGMVDTGFIRSDDLPAAAALGYLASGRTNVFHLPVRGAGDGGIYSTADDLERLWRALFDGRIITPSMVDTMVGLRTIHTDEPHGYGLGFWVWASGRTVEIHGCDGGVSCQTVHDRDSGITYAVLSNDSNGAWPIAQLLDRYIEKAAALS